MRTDIKRRKLLRQQLSHEAKLLLRCLLAFITDVELKLEMDLERDAEEVRRRTADEGLGYLGKRLPEFWSWFVSSLDAGKLLPPNRMRLAHGSATRPAFLQELVKVVFDEEGQIRPKPQDEKQVARMCVAVESINTICNSFGKKYEVPLDPETTDAQLLELKWQDENATLNHGAELLNLGREATRIIQTARRLLVDLFSDYERPGIEDGEYKLLTHSFWDQPVIPRFGPGACVEGYNSLEKYTNLFRLPPLKAIGSLRLAEVCSASPSCNNGLAVETFTTEQLRYAAGGRRVADAMLVPKNLGEGRVIMPQENDMMYLQKGYQVATYGWVEGHPLTSGLINFLNQTVNGQLALRASADRTYDTIDLKRASDTVTRGEVGLLFDEKYAEMLLTLRNDKVRIGLMDKNGAKRYITWDMQMHAAMGSALCFPVEAMVFWAIATAALELAEAPNRKVYVFGDDLLVPHGYYDIVCSALSEMGHVVNRKKSFAKGYFRESCGVDAFYGRKVSPAFRISKRVPTIVLPRTDRNRSTVAWVEYANLAEERDNLFLAEAIRMILCENEHKCKSFPETGDIFETNEGYLAFYVQGFPSIRERLAKKVERPHTETRVKFSSRTTLILERYVTGGNSVFDPCRINPHVPERKGSQGSFFEPNCFMAPTLNLYATKNRLLDVSEEQFPDNLAYLRWQLEKPENIREFPMRDTLDIVRRRFLLS